MLFEKVNITWSMDRVNNVLDELLTFNTVELTDLMKLLEDIFISSQIPENTIVETIVENTIKENTSVNVNIIIKSVPADKKITLLKLVRTITGLGLKESKAFVDNLPQILKENILKDEALQIQKDLETTGAEIFIESI